MSNFMNKGYKKGNGYGGIVPTFDGRDKLYLEVAGVAPGSEAYQKLCEWYEPRIGELKGRDCAAAQAEMVRQAFPNMLEAAELMEHLRGIFPGDKEVLAELIIRRYGLDTPSFECRTAAEVAAELAQEYHYAESTVRTTMGRTALDALKRDEHFREALYVPELSNSFLRYLQFVCMLLTKTEMKIEDVDWDEERTQEAAKKLKGVGVGNPEILDQTVEHWLSALPEEARLATKLRYGLGYPAISRTDDYITAASGFDLKQINLLNFLTVKLNRTSLAAIFGVDVSEIDYLKLKKEMGIEREMLADIETLGLQTKVAAALHDGGVCTAIGLLEIDMFSEEDQPWSEYVPSRYWREVVQLWTDLRIRHETDEYQFEDGKYLYEKVS